MRCVTWVYHMRFEPLHASRLTLDRSPAPAATFQPNPASPMRYQDYICNPNADELPDNPRLQATLQPSDPQKGHDPSPPDG